MVILTASMTETVATSSSYYVTITDVSGITAGASAGICYGIEVDFDWP